MRKPVIFLLGTALVLAVTSCGRSGAGNTLGDLPMPLYSFLEEYDFGGKTIIPFITHGGSRASRTIDTIAELEPEAQVFSDALVISREEVADSEKTVTDWAKSLAIEN